MKRKTLRIETRGMMRAPITAARGLAAVSTEVRVQKIEVNETGRRKRPKFKPRFILRKAS